MILHRRHLDSFGLVCTLLGLVGCASPTHTGRDDTQVAQDEKPSALFLQRYDYPDWLGVVMQEVVYAHRFSVPWIILRASDCSTWFVAERFESTLRFDRLHVRITPQQKVTASITAYQYGPSDWAILGSLFVDFEPETNAIAAEVSSKLSNSGHRVRP